MARGHKSCSKYIRFIVSYRSSPALDDARGGDALWVAVTDQPGLFFITLRCCNFSPRGGNDRVYQGLVQNYLGVADVKVMLWRRRSDARWFLGIDQYDFARGEEELRHATQIPAGLCQR